MMNTTEINRLIQKSLSGRLTEEEQLVLFTWLNESDENKHMYATVKDAQALMSAFQFKTKATRTPRHKWWWGVAAACVGMAMAVWGLYMFTGHGGNDQVAAGGIENRIKLISADETYVISTDSLTEKVVEQNELPGNVRSGEQKFNRLIVPYGKVFSIRLCDGTIVRLNSMSELHFPSEFAGNERRVELKGEAFFEVAHNAASPFILSTEHSTIRVLGTRFNVSAYADAYEETISLVEGCVEAQAMKQQVKLMPGEQVVVAENQDVKKSDFNPEQVMAWMDGVFFFEDQPLDVVLKAIERWYQVEFEFTADELKKMEVYVRIRKEKPIEDLFRALETTQRISFRQEGNKILVEKMQR